MLFFANILGWIVANKRIVLYIATLGILLIVITAALKSCNKPQKLNEQEIQKGEAAVKERNDRELKNILVNADVREAAIDSNLKQAEEVRQNAIANYSNMNTADLAAELERRR